MDQRDAESSARPAEAADERQPAVPVQQIRPVATPAPAPPVPSLPPALSVPPAPPGCGGDGTARGEHVHSEPPAPRQPRRHSVRAQVLAALREALLSGELQPGEVYSAPVLAARFGVSPTPVREAMQQLVSEGAVETVPNRGFRVARCSARDLAELAEVRALLEVPVLLALARSRPPESWAALRPLAEAALGCALRGDLAGYVAADQAFHVALLEECGNRQLLRLVGELCGRSRGVADVAALRGAAAQHHALLDALGAQDHAAAERLLRTHLTP